MMKKGKEKEKEKGPSASVTQVITFPVIGKIVEWKVKPSQRVEHNTILCTYSFLNKSQNEMKNATLVAPYDCEIVKLFVQVDQELKANQPIIEVLTECQHSIVFGQLCASCGAFVEEDSKKVAVYHGDQIIKMSVDEAQRHDSEANRQRIQHRKLILVCDLDQTLVHATDHASIGTLLKDPNHNLENVYPLQMPRANIHYIRLRPGLREFLQEMTKLYELHIYTFGNKPYANAVANVLDPKKELFQERIISRDECPNMSFKTLQRIFPMDDSMAVIIDDRGDVWNWSPNLILVRPYEYFLGVGDIHAPHRMRSKKPKKPKNQLIEGNKNNKNEDKEVNDDTKNKNEEEVDEDEAEESEEEKKEQENQKMEENNKKNELYEENQQIIGITQVKDEDHDDELVILKEILTDLHTKFYEEIDTGMTKPELKKILELRRKEVFDGIRMAFSGVIPHEIPQERSEVWRRAEFFGAECFFDVGDSVTHLVAMRRTDKVNRAMSDPCICIVSYEWFKESIRKWKRQDERLFQLEDAHVDNELRLEAGLTRRETKDFFDELHEIEAMEKEMEEDGDSDDGSEASSSKKRKWSDVESENENENENDNRNHKEYNNNDENSNDEDNDEDNEDLDSMAQELLQSIQKESENDDDDDDDFFEKEC